MKWEVKWGGRHYFVREFDSTENTNMMFDDTYTHTCDAYVLPDTYQDFGRARDKNYMYFVTFYLT